MLTLPSSRMNEQLQFRDAKLWIISFLFPLVGEPGQVKAASNSGFLYSTYSICLYQSEYKGQSYSTLMNLRNLEGVSLDNVLGMEGLRGNFRLRFVFYFYFLNYQ